MRQSEPTPPTFEPESLPTEKVFRNLYEKTVGPVAGWLFRLRVSERDWKDAIQEIYLEAWRSWTSFNPELGKREQWLYGIAVNVAGRFRERLRSRGRWEVSQSDDLDHASSDANAEDYMQINDRARFTVQFFDPIKTLPLAIMIAHDMNGEPMKEIAARHGISLSESYRLRDQAKHLFTEGYEREQEKRRKSGALILPFGALALLEGPHDLPELPRDLKEDFWTQITQKIQAELSPGGAPQPPEPPLAQTAPAASIPPGPSTATAVRGTVAKALRIMLTAHPVAAPALIFASGALTGIVGARLFDSPDKSKDEPVVQEAPSALGIGASPALAASAPLIPHEALTPPRASDSTEIKAALAPTGSLTPAETIQYDIVRAAFASQRNDSVFKAIQDYVKSYPRGHFLGDCEKMRIQTLIRLGRLQEAREAVAHFRKRSPNSPLLKEIESTLPSP